MAKKKTVTAVKAFDKDMQCRDFQFEVGGKYKHGGKGRVFAIAANTDGKASLKSIYRACRPNMALNARTAMR